MKHLVWRKLGIIVLLLVLPFVLFFGSSGSTTVNGRVVSEYSVNYLGILLAVIGLVMSAKVAFRRSVSERLDAETTPGWVRGAAAVLAVLAVAQIAVQAGFIAT
ncbi:hypothetical protein GXW78_04965 [Roseomonas terrae]|jgi:hypothetical protein|uniref:Uncharacterized protein n=1 Tax=Neoroseomonas terrae TaxID=424799 RepID=A0ABS5EDB2_9PROT|nr:hypothetical protein [Neoroseomonas terrae]MBR0649003.1 hypothetical protein [Neoroseomonas terrae]